MYPPDFVAWVKETHPDLSSLVDPPPRETVPELIRRVGRERYGADGLSHTSTSYNDVADEVEEYLCRSVSPAS